MSKIDRRYTATVFLFTLLMFARLICCDFTWWDDPQTIHHNPLLNPPTLASLGHYWTALGSHAPMGLYVPVTYTVWWLLAWALRTKPMVDGIAVNPIVFHGFNVLLHATSTALVFVILRKLIDDRTRPGSRLRLRERIAREDASDSLAAEQKPSIFPALAGALLFAIHPVQVETVAWASGTKDLLCGLFTLLAIQQYLRADMRSYVLSLISVALAMLSKPTAVVVPLLLWAIGYLMLDRSPKQLLKQLWPMLALMIPCALIARWSQPAAFSSPLSIAYRPLIAADAIGFYLHKIILPLHLSPDYGRSPASLLHSGLLGLDCVTALLGVIAVAALGRRIGFQKALTAAALFMLPLLPVLGFQPFMYQYHSTVTDHYLYLPMVGVAAGLASLALGRSANIALTIVLALLAIRTLARELDWQNTRTLFADAAQHYPTFGNYDMLAFTYALDASHARRAGDAESAERAAETAMQLYSKAIALNPLDVPARDNLARLLLNAGLRDAAIEQVREIIALQPRLPIDLRAKPADLQQRLHEYESVR